ncbi:MAG TPA: hypothetical protein VGN90_11180 [Pyrinomonadaceae bacterium]|jgi:hypothetical protein|nr:hypothetical protein [Pyrinomonadaceae bacterium]
MRPKFPMFAASFLLLFVVVLAQTSNAKTNPNSLAFSAVSENSAEAAMAIAELRARGRRD